MKIKIDKDGSFKENNGLFVKDNTLVFCQPKCRDIIIPENINITRIGTNAFASCPDLKSINLESLMNVEPPTFEGQPGCKKTIQVVVPFGKIAAYRKTEWNDYFDLKQLYVLSLEKESLTLIEKDTEIVNITSGNDNYSVENSNPSVVTSSLSKNTIVVKSIQAGNATITVTDRKSGQSKSFNVKVLNANGHAYIDLGLPSGLKWATYNVGATRPEQYGDYYAWGEVTQKSVYNWKTYKWGRGSNTSLTKYINDSKYGIVDGKLKLDLSDDVAHMKWGGDWRMPTSEDFDELFKKCSKKRVKLNGVNVWQFIGPNGNSIYFPADGTRSEAVLLNTGILGNYWTSTGGGNDYATEVGSNTKEIWKGGLPRFYGVSVRPVLGE